MNATPLLQVKDLRVDFAQGKGKVFQALKGVSLNIHPGETVGLVGESGSGKTTVGRVILGLTEATSGQVIFDEEDITQASRARRRALGRDIQVVFQDPYGSLNPARTVGDTLAEPLLGDKSLSPTDIQQRISEVLQRVGMPTDTAQRYPGQFSGGQRQRIAIARAMLKNAPLLLLDEATSALDAQSERMVQAALEQAMAGRTTLVIAHRLATVQRADVIWVLDRGRLVEQGTHAQLLARGGLYASLAALQFTHAAG